MVPASISLIKCSRYIYLFKHGPDTPLFGRWIVAVIVFFSVSLAPFFSTTAKAQHIPNSPSTPSFPDENTPLAAVDSQNLAVPITEHRPRLEDFLSGEFPAGFLIVSNFRQLEPGDGNPVSQPTSAAVAYDNQNLYVAFICRDAPRKVRARMSKRENISDDDSVIVYLDTFNEGQRAYYFKANPLGIQADGLRTTEKDADSRFDTLWHSDGRVTDFGYVVLFSIPFKSLRFSTELQQKWGIALGRSIVRNNETAFWPFVTSRKSSFLQQLGPIELTGVTPGRNIQVIPYAAYNNAKLLDESKPEYYHDDESRGGVDAKMVLGNAFAFDLTYNPDFSQVESDDPQVTVNKRFEVNFPEKRPFFLENINYFETPLNLFYTRRVADPEFGGRLTGKAGHWNIGAFVIDDRLPGDEAEADSPLFDERAINGVARTQYTFGRDSNVGALITGRRFGDTNNTVFSADSRLALTDNWTFTGQLAFSNDVVYENHDETERFTGQAYFADLSYGSRHFNYALTYEDISPDFETPLGFIERTDIRKASQYASYYFYPENISLQSFGPSLTLGANWDHEGELQDRYSLVDFSMDFTGPVGFTLSRYDAYENYLAEDFNHGYTEVSFYANMIKSFTFYGGGLLGTGVNYSTPEGVDPFVGDIMGWNLGFNWRPLKRLSIDSYYNYNRFRASEDFGLQSDVGRKVFTNQFNRTKFNLQFTKELSLRLIVDYNFLSPNPDFFDAEQFEEIECDVLLTYLFNPFTAVYIGYNSGFENFEEYPQGSGLRRSGSPDYLTHRQFFVKLSYLFQF